MHKFFTIFTALLILFSCSQQKQDLKIEQAIARVENGLIEFKSPASMFQPDSARRANPKKIGERMEFYKVPGVSIAVINNFHIEWAKAYGVMNANTGEPVTTETIFEAASTSKFVTAVMALHFVQKGLID